MPAKKKKVGRLEEITKGNAVVPDAKYQSGNFNLYIYIKHLKQPHFSSPLPSLLHLMND